MVTTLVGLAACGGKLKQPNDELSGSPPPIVLVPADRLVTPTSTVNGVTVGGEQFTGTVPWGWSMLPNGGFTNDPLNPFGNASNDFIANPYFNSGAGAVAGTPYVGGGAVATNPSVVVVPNTTGITGNPYLNGGIYTGAMAGNPYVAAGNPYLAGNPYVAGNPYLAGNPYAGANRFTGAGIFNRGGSVFSSLPYGGVPGYGGSYGRYVPTGPARVGGFCRTPADCPRDGHNYLCETPFAGITDPNTGQVVNFQQANNNFCTVSCVKGGFDPNCPTTCIDRMGGLGGGLFGGISGIMNPGSQGITGTIGDLVTGVGSMVGNALSGIFGGGGLNAGSFGSFGNTICGHPGGYIGGGNAGGGGVTVDQQRPIVTIISPTTSDPVDPGSVTVQASVTDNSVISSVELYIDGQRQDQRTQPKDPANPSIYELYGSITQAGDTHTVEIVATDNSGNTTRQSMQVTVGSSSSASPQVLVNPPTTATVPSSYTVTGQVSDDSMVTEIGVTIGTPPNAVAAAPAQTVNQKQASFQFNIQLSPGTQTITVLAMDDAGNRGENSITVTVDGTPVNNNNTGTGTPQNTQGTGQHGDTCNTDLICSTSAPRCVSDPNFGSFCSLTCTDAVPCPNGAQCKTVTGTSEKICGPPMGADGTSSGASGCNASGLTKGWPMGPTLILLFVLSLLRRRRRQGDSHRRLYQGL